MGKIKGHTKPRMTDLASIELWGKEREWQTEGGIPSNSIHLRLLLIQLTRMLPTLPIWSLNMLLKFEQFPVPLHKPQSRAQQLPNVNLDLLGPFLIHAFMSCQPFHPQMQSFRCKPTHFHLSISPQPPSLQLRHHHVPPIWRLSTTLCHFDFKWPSLYHWHQLNKQSCKMGMSSTTNTCWI